VVALVAACQPQVTQPPDPTVAAGDAYSLCPAGGEPPAKEITDDAVRILTARLELLGVSDPEISIGTCIEIGVSQPSEDPAAVESAVLGTGDVAIYPVPPEQAATILIGGEPPTGIEPIVGPDDFVDAATATDADAGGPTLTLTLSDAGGAALQTWTAAHVQQNLALVVDGLVIAMPVINEPITDGSIVLSFGSINGGPPIPPDAIRAMVMTGPLPLEWAQPQRPQG
jgi:preprotein translocase subunit SecD